MMFIELTFSENLKREKILVNARHIEAILPTKLSEPDGEGARVYLIAGAKKPSIQVRESYNEIHEMLKITGCCLNHMATLFANQANQTKPSEAGAPLPPNDA